MTSSDSSSKPAPRIDSEYLRRRREAEIAAHLESARRALEDERDVEGARRALDDAMILNPDDSRVRALWDRLETAGANGEKGATVDTGRPVRWRIASGVSVVTLCVFAVVFWRGAPSDTGQGRTVEQLLASADEAMDAGQYGEAAAFFSEVLSSDREHTRAAAGLAIATRAIDEERQRVVDAVSAQARSRAAADTGELTTSRLGPGRIAGVELSSSEPQGQVADTPAPPESRPVQPARVPPVSRPADIATSSGPIIHVSLCGDETACGTLTVRVQPTADVLFNSVMIGTAAQGVLRLPTGRHQVRLESETYQFRRMVDIEAGSSGLLNVNLEDDGLPRDGP